MPKRKLLVPDSDYVIDQLKSEIAAEFGVPDYELIDKGRLSSKFNGAVGGEIVKRLVAFAEDRFEG